MSLSREEMQRSAEDLQRYLRASGLNRDELAQWVGLDRATVDHALAMDGIADPVDVWLIRDALNDEASGCGAPVDRWRVLTDSARENAEQWFPLRDLPPRP